MKTYQSGTKESKKNFFKRHKYALALIVSVLVVAAIIVLSVVFTLPEDKAPVVDSGNVVEPPNQGADTEPVISMPISGATVGMDYADDRLVFWETLDLWQWHPAVDFVGSGDVVAIMDGKVLDVEKTTIDGNVVTIEHSDGYVSVYKSLGNDVAVKKGDTVKAGNKIGTSSTSMMSELTTGDHVHFELKKNGKYVNPSTVLPMNEDK